MEIYKIENVSFSYPEREKKALQDISFTVNKGEFVIICGESGCGKTTLLKLLKPSLSPHGNISGKIYFNGISIENTDMRNQASKTGFVMQNPDNQIVTDKVWHELAFGLESLGVSTPEIRARVAEMASFFGIQTWFHKNVSELSGGQKQLLNLASVMVMQPEVLILDEPTSQLDPISASEFLKNLEKINRELGVTIILTEHRLEDAFPLAERAIVLDKGSIISDDGLRKTGENLKKLKHNMYYSLPTPMRVYGEVEDGCEYPVTVREGKYWLEKYNETSPLNPDNIPRDRKESASNTVIEIKDAYFRYEKNLPDVLKGFNLKVGKGELFAITGGNGTGKTTALSLMCGINSPYRGEVLIKGERLSKIHNLYNGVLGVLPQNPQALFVKKTVYLDLLEMLDFEKISKEEKDSKIIKTASVCRISELLESHPYDLSGGEQQRAALAKVLLTNPEILILDEPTKGMDSHFKMIFADILNRLKAQGVTIVMVSHDIEFCAEYADRCALLFDGNIVSEDTPRKFFAGKSFYTTSANRMAREILPEAVLADDIILALGRSLPEKEKYDFNNIDKEDFNKEGNKKKEIIVNKTKGHKKTSNKAVYAALLALLAIPLTIYIGLFCFEERNYYITSLFIIFETLIPFCMMFEARKPQARELVVISVICAVAVVGRAAFFMLPQFKPVVALVIISGICFGGETGFLVGVITAFVSNFFFGQGPWTPWQMFAHGLIGFLSGMIFKDGIIRKTKASLCVFGFLATILIYGIIMNSSSVILAQKNPTFEMFATAWISGLTFDIVHGVSTAFFLWVMAESMINKLERVKIKYGLIE